MADHVSGQRAEISFAGQKFQNKSTAERHELFDIDTRVIDMYVNLITRQNPSGNALLISLVSFERVNSGFNNRPSANYLTIFKTRKIQIVIYAVVPCLSVKPATSNVIRLSILALKASGLGKGEREKTAEKVAIALSLSNRYFIIKY
ncbi:uncharacterized protein L203_102793 [Cryptococcus depauperatus CBS 7841]|uniref:Uncharacterized protein n=1 Tax=Cryptococcus depauperatus CBS 7841 TaxID=1295531 RepID=A0AAJ8M053_9TREE